MFLVDANILIYESNEGAEEHPAARAWLEDVLNGDRRVGLPWVTLLAYVRVAVNPRAFRRPLTVAEALSQVARWLALPVVWAPEPTARHPVLLAELLGPNPHPRLVTDAHLAALAIEHGLTLCSADGDFARFPGLRWKNPLEGD